MKKGFAFLIVIAVVGLILVGGVSAFVAAKNFSKTDAPRKVDIKTIPLPSGKAKVVYASPPAAPTNSQNKDGIADQSIAPGIENSQGVPSVYSEPQGKYKISLPADWKFNGTSTTATYSSSKFTGNSGDVSITVGSGKDPFGGCSETTNVVLADRTIPGCFLLQKDGSQVLTRVYTKDSKGVAYTIEAYINPQITYNRPTILEIIKSIQIY